MLKDLCYILDMDTARAFTWPAYRDRLNTCHSFISRHAHPSLCTAKRVRDYYFHGKLPEVNASCEVEFVHDFLPHPGFLMDLLYRDGFLFPDSAGANIRNPGVVDEDDHRLLDVLDRLSKRVVM